MGPRVEGYREMYIMKRKSKANLAVSDYILYMYILPYTYIFFILSPYKTNDDDHNILS